MDRLKKFAVVVATLAVSVALAPSAVAAPVLASEPTAATTANATGMSPNTLTVVANIVRANEKTAFDYFVAKGLTKKQAAGIIGNLDQESGMDPTIKQYGGGPGRGIAQWSVGGRWDTYSGDNEVHYTNVVLGISRYNLTGQLKFVWHELSDFSYYGLAQVKASTTINGAVLAFQDHYEGCGTCNPSAREKYAADAYSRYA
ncbi:MAG: phage tail tip lysozyme [Nakamurella sp.]